MDVGFDKRGQVSLFVIIAVVVIAIIGVVIYFNSSGKYLNEGSFNDHPVYNFVQSCVDETLEKGIEVVGLQGGYYNDPVLSKFYLNYNVPYYWSENVSSVPSVGVIEEELSKYMEDNLRFCLNEFEIYGDSEYEIKSQVVKVKSLKVGEELIEVELDFPVSVGKGDDTSNFRKFSSEMNNDLKKARDFSFQIIEEQKKNPNEMPVGYITQLAVDNGFEFETVYLEDSDVLYTLILGSEDSEFIYAFVVDYEWEVEEDETG